VLALGLAAIAVAMGLGVYGMVKPGLELIIGMTMLVLVVVGFIGIYVGVFG